MEKDKRMRSKMVSSEQNDEGSDTTEDDSSTDDGNIKFLSMLNSKIPGGSLDQKWTNYKGHCKLVNPANKRKLEVIIVGTGLAGASAAASLGELGYNCLL